MAGLVALGVVRVGGVGHVGRRRRPSRRGPGGGRRGRRRGPATSRSSTVAQAARRRRRWPTSLPTSSWSNRQTTGTSAGAGAGWRRDSAATAAQHEQRLSSRARASSSLVDAQDAPGREVVDHDVPRQDVVGGSTPSSLGQEARRSRPRRARRAPQTGARCCWGLSIRPSVVDSRSRWMASCGTRSSGRSTRSRRISGRRRRPRTATRPERPRSRSSQELSSAPP